MKSMQYLRFNIGALIWRNKACDTAKYVMLSVAFFFSAQVAAVETEINYILVNEWYAEANSFKNADHLYNPASLPEDIYVEAAGGFSISDSTVFDFSGNEKFKSVGRVEDCDGFQGKCLVVGKILKLFLPADFTDQKPLTWRWKNYSFASIIKKDYCLLGQDLHIVEIVSKCTDCLFNTVRYQYDRDRGIIGFRLNADGVMLDYLLSNSKGFLAP